VVGFGGDTKQYIVDVDPLPAEGSRLSLGQLTQNIACQPERRRPALTLGEQSFKRAGLGLIRSLDDIGQIVLARSKGTAVRVRDVAQVREGAAPRLGIVGRDLEPDVVQGIVLMRYGGSSLETLKGVHERVESDPQDHLLPWDGDRDLLRPRAPGAHDHAHGAEISSSASAVTVVLWVFLGQARAAMVGPGEHPPRPDGGVLRNGLTRQPANLISLARWTSHHRRFHRHHGGEHLPPPGRARAGQRAGPDHGRGVEIGGPMISPLSSSRSLSCALHHDGRGRRDLSHGAHSTHSQSAGGAALGDI